MRLERERPDGRRDFWEARVDGRRLTITTGIVGGAATSKTERFLVPGRARASLAKQAEAQRAAGFDDPDVLATRSDPLVGPRNPALEDAMRTDRDSPGAVSVYADWLQAQGSALGELMVLQLAGTADAARSDRARELTAQLRLPDANHATWGWKHGRWEWLHLDNQVGSMDEGFDAVTFARRLFASPLCAALDELRVGVLRWELNDRDVPAILADAAQHAWAPALSRLHLGAVDPDIDMDHHCIGDVGAAISRAFPGLTSLTLHSGGQEWREGVEAFGVAGLALPRLTSLVVETCTLTRERLAALLASELPALARLELWFGATEQGATAAASDLTPLFDGAVFAGVDRLALKNHELSTALLPRLAAAPIASRLVELDLSMSTFDDRDARTLAAAAGRFPALRTLGVDDCYLSDDGLAALRAAFPACEVVSHAQPKLGYAHAGDRYVSVWE